MERYTCTRCDNTFSTKWNLKRHKRSICDIVEVPPVKRSRRMYRGMKPTNQPAQAGPSGMGTSTSSLNDYPIDPSAQTDHSGMHPSTAILNDNPI
ncbi:unnamed protein product, partial [Callosobruchus maculatus]